MAVSAAVLFCGMTPLYIHADFDSSQENLRIYELSMLDADPLYTLKKSVLYNRSIDDESLDLTNVDREYSEDYYITLTVTLLNDKDA